MKTSKQLAFSIVAFTMAAAAVALTCPYPNPPVWNPAEGTCVSGFFTNYCQDTELQVDGGCAGANGNPVHCEPVAQTPEIKQIYTPMYTGQCTLDQSTNPA